MTRVQGVSSIMRFSDSCASIPDRLIALQEKGETVFLCGAGVSQRYELPSFHSLTVKVYERLGEHWSGHPAEEDAMGERPGNAPAPPALDRALFALGKRLRGSDAASRLRAERRLVDAVEVELQPKPGSYAAHGDIWTLSRDAEMRGRVVTTNFDTLFERAIQTGAISRAGPDLPPPLGTDFAGILHLHGRIADGALQLRRTNLVLNSAEFGEAYLRAGWAARYVYDLARASTIVIVGYGADDPPMRYILEVLSADRERYPDIREIFAFVPCAPTPDAHARITAIWDAKGATAIPYDSTSLSDHDALYETISHWARFAKDPTDWRRSEAERILRGVPDDVTEDDWERLKWVLSASDAGALIGDIDPAPQWAASFGSLGIFAADRVSPVPWIANRLEDRDMPSAVIEHIPLSRSTISGIDHLVTWRGPGNAPLSPIFHQAWRLIVDTAAERTSIKADLGARWYRALTALKGSDHSRTVRGDIVACVTPRMRLREVFIWPGLEPEPCAALRLKDVLRIDWELKERDKLDVVVAQWPQDQRRALLRSLQRTLDDALDIAVDTQTIEDVSNDIRSISPHEQDRFPDGFHAIVRLIVDLWHAEVAARPIEAREMAQVWLASDPIILQRMGLHALREGIFVSSEIANGILRLTDEAFWLSDCRRETMQLFVHRWAGMDAHDRERVEQRIVDGLPSALLNPDGPPDQLALVRDHAAFIRLARIEGAGTELSPSAQAKLDELRALYPVWESDGEQDDFRIWSSGMMTLGAQGDLSLLQDVPPDRLLSRVAEVVGSDPHGQGELWRLYCDTDPNAALDALLASDPAAAEMPGAWRSFFWSITSSDDARIHPRAFEAIAVECHGLQARPAILDWLLGKRQAIGADSDAVLKLWDRLFAASEKANIPVEEQTRGDPVFSMLNSAEGKLGTLLLAEYDRLRDGDPAIRKPVLDRAERLIGSPHQLGFLGSASIMDGLPALFQDEPDWTTRHLVPLTAWSSEFAPAAWSVILRARLPRPGLYEALKPNLLLAGTHAELDRALENIGAWLLLPLLWAQHPNGPVPGITALEARQALARSIGSVRSSAAYWFSNAIDQLPESSAENWRNRLSPLFASVWPLEPDLRTKSATIHLVRLVLKTGEAFAEAVDLLAPALCSLDPWEVEIWLSPEDAAQFYRSAPAAMLRLVEAVLSSEAVPARLGAMLALLVQHDPSLEDDHGYRKLLGWARRRAAP